jgi:ATP-dependent RNA helicase DDX56/DBP9
MKRKLDEHDVPAPVEGELKANSAPAASSFVSFGLDARLLQAIAKEGFSTPTPIQAQAIPLALQGKDVVGELCSCCMLRLY